MTLQNFCNRPDMYSQLDSTLLQPQKDRWHHCNNIVQEQDVPVGDAGPGVCGHSWTPPSCSQQNTTTTAVASQVTALLLIPTSPGMHSYLAQICVHSCSWW